MAKNSLNIPFALLISLLVIASVMIIKGELKKNRFQIETVKSDINMLKEARFGVLFKSTKKIIAENKKFFNCNSYNSLLRVINKKHREWS